MKIDAKTFLEENKNNRAIFRDLETTLEAFINWRESKTLKGFGSTPEEVCKRFNETFKVGEEIMYRKNILVPFEKEKISKKAFVMHGLPVFSMLGSSKHYIINTSFILFK